LPVHDREGAERLRRRPQRRDARLPAAPDDPGAGVRRGDARQPHHRGRRRAAGGALPLYGGDGGWARGGDAGLGADLLRRRRLPWLRVADASLFPDSLEINPYVTIMALADRVAEAIRADAPALLGAEFA